MFPDLSPYNFAGNTPIQVIDLQGLQPESVVTKNSDGKYRFTEPAIKLMSWLSGTDEETVRNTNLKPRSRPFGAPWYGTNNKGDYDLKYKRGGAMTSDEKIRYTRNFFKGWGQAGKKPNAYYGGNDDRAVFAW